MTRTLGLGVSHFSNLEVKLYKIIVRHYTLFLVSCSKLFCIITIVVAKLSMLMLKCMCICMQLLRALS